MFSPKNYLIRQAQRPLSAAASAQRAEDFARQRSALAAVSCKAWFGLMGEFTLGASDAPRIGEARHPCVTASLHPWT